MNEKLFIGIADNNRCASVIVGDSSGRIIRTGVGGSVNYHFCGVKQARVNLQNIINQVVGCERRTRLAEACFTYKYARAADEKGMMALISGFFDETNVKVEDFATSCTLGIPGSKERLLLVGGRKGLAVFRAESGLNQMRRDREYRGSPFLRLDTHWEKIVKLGTEADLDAFLHMKKELDSSACLVSVARLLDDYVNQGSPWALDVAAEMAHALVLLVAKMVKQFGSLDPVIGFYGPILLGSQTIRRRVERVISLLLPKCEIREAAWAPAKGACLSSLLTRNSIAPQEVVTNFHNSARRIRQKGWLDLVANTS